MIAFANLLIALAGVLHWVIEAYNWVLIARVVISWLSPDPRNQIVMFIYSATEPLLERVRRKVPPVGMFDVAIIVVFLALYFLDAFLVHTLADYGEQLRLSTVL
jgi:YggT family protein